MLPIRTKSLTVRMLGEPDIARFVGYRNDPDIARLQSWDLPYTEDAAHRLVDEQSELSGPTDGQWVQMAVDRDGDMIGDVAVHLHGGGGIAEIGFTLAAEHQGHGYAVEAAAAVVDALVEHTAVQRFEAGVDPGNVASMRVAEGLGMQFEGLARMACLCRGEWADDLRYAMTRADRLAWKSRDRAAPAGIEFVEITPETAYLFGRLATHYSQQRFVSPMALSFRDALFPDIVDGAPVVPWMRGIVADDERVGFIMTAEVTDHHPEPYLWRLLIDRRHQRRGIGERVVAMLIEQLRGAGHRTLTVSYGLGPGGPEPFYARLGFVPTGELDGDEVVARLVF
jgi:RimJ/RimL family protein N-acetyltransferase